MANPGGPFRNPRPQYLSPNFNMQTGQQINTPSHNQGQGPPPSFHQHSNGITQTGSFVAGPAFPPRPGYTVPLFPPPPFVPPPCPPPHHGVPPTPSSLPPNINYATPPPFPYPPNNAIPPQIQQVRIPLPNLSLSQTSAPQNQYFNENVPGNCFSYDEGNKTYLGSNSNIIKPKTEPADHEDNGQDSGKKKIQAWLESRGKGKAAPKFGQREKASDSVFKINDYLCNFQNMKNLIAKMSSQIANLESISSTADKTFWSSECAEFDDVKAKVVEMENLFDDKVVLCAAKKLHRIKHKRARMKRKRQAASEESVKVLEARQTIDKRINEWQKQLEDEMKEEKLKKERKINMDRTLAEITKKIQDANRLIETMSAVEKLRLIRRDAAEKRGDSDLGESRQNVSQKIEDMKRLVKGQLEVYKEEEQALRDAIKSEHEESNKKEKQMQQEKDEAEKKMKDRQLHSILFGHFDDADVSDPLYPYQEFYKQAQKSLPALLQIRQEWDRYLSSDECASAIPSGWVFPSEPSSKPWVSAVVGD